jgi:ketosteroid isomerase-like protein
MATHDEKAISDLIETYRQGFLALDPAQLGSIWDKSHDPLIYIAQEKGEPIYGWPAIERYLAELPEHLEYISAMELDGISIDLLGDSAAVYFRFRAKGKLNKQEGSHEPVGRVTMIFRRTPNGWRAIHYHESALAAHAVRKP